MLKVCPWKKRVSALKVLREAAKSSFFNGIATKALPPPLELSGKMIF